MTTSSTGVPITDPPGDPTVRAGEGGPTPTAGDSHGKRRSG